MFEKDENLEHDFEYINDHKFDKSLDQFSKMFIEENLRSNGYNELTYGDVLVTPSHHNGTLPYHLEGTIGRLSDKLLPRPDTDLNTRNQKHPTSQQQSSNFEDSVETNQLEHKFKTDNKGSEINVVHKEDNNLRRHLKVNSISGKAIGIESLKESGLAKDEDTDLNFGIRGTFSHEDSFNGIIRFNEKEQLHTRKRANTGSQNLFREARQGGSDNESPQFGEVASARPNNNGQKCINKVVLESQTEYDDIVVCKHSYDKRCHTTYSTDYEPTQEEKCDENFRKNCFIEYSQTAYNETVQICRQPLLKDCNLSGPEICRTEYESECWTRNEAHDVTDDVVECKEVKEEKCVDETSGYTTEQKCSLWPVQKCEVQAKQVKKFLPKTKCTKVPKELCAPAGCGFTPGPEQCYDKVQTVLGQHPEENCSLEPQTTCKHITKLVPKLVAREECLDVPKEVCTRSKANPRRTQKPVVKKWCYTPSEESGLA